MNVVRLLGVHRDHVYTYICLELCSSNLRRLLKEPKNLAEMALSLMKQIASGMEYLHDEQGI